MDAVRTIQVRGNYDRFDDRAVEHGDLVEDEKEPVLRGARDLCFFNEPTIEYANGAVLLFVQGGSIELTRTQRRHHEPRVGLVTP